MRPMIVVSLVIGIFAVACVGELGGLGGEQEVDAERSPVLSWRLEADENQALYDPRYPDVLYPNPRSAEALEIILYDDAEICATDGESYYCGGVLHGIPYTVRARVADGELFLLVTDIHGNDIDEFNLGAYENEESNAPEEAAREPVCYDTLTPSGLECVVCTDEGGAITSNTCIETAEQPDGFNAALEGARSVVENINAYLDQIGIDAELPIPDLNDFVDFDEGEIDLGDPQCEDILEHLDDEFSDDHQGTDDYVFGPEAVEECLQDGDCRIGQLVTRAMAEACTQIPEGGSVLKASLGIIGAGGYAISAMCDGDEQLDDFSMIEDCVGSPLVIDINGDGLQLQGPEAGTYFPLLGSAELNVGWLAGSDDVLIALDQDGDGAITSGRELFGDATNGWASDGFAALAHHDFNGDSVIDQDDPVFPKLLAWCDDGDAISQPWELISLSAAGVVSIPLNAMPTNMSHPSGNELGLGADALMVGGEVAPVIDVYFAMTGNAS